MLEMILFRPSCGFAMSAGQKGNPISVRAEAVRVCLSDCLSICLSVYLCCVYTCLKIVCVAGCAVEKVVSTIFGKQK